MKTLTTDVLSEKGNLKRDVALALKEQAGAYLESLGFEKKPNGKYAKEIATVGEKTVTMNVEMSIGLDTNFNAKEKEKKTTETKSVEIENLFD